MIARYHMGWGIAVLALLLAAPALLRTGSAQFDPAGPAPGTQPPPPPPPPADHETLYEDPTGKTSATVNQIIPGTPGVSLSTLTQVERIRMTQNVFLVYYGQGALTILPREHVASMTVNRRRNAGD